MGSPTCPACSHPPHLGACSRRMGGTAYSCGCLRQTPTPPAPADDAREKGLAAYDALNMREKSEIAAQAPRYCYAKGYVAALAGRADDASGAEAMREAWAKTFGQILVRSICESEPSGEVIDAQDRLKGTDAETFLVIKPSDLAEWVQRHASDALHDGEIALPLPAGDDAVEEAAKRVTTAYKDLRELMERRRGGGFAVSVNLGPLYEACDALDTALRREKESRSDDSRPASGQGGA